MNKFRGIYSALLVITCSGLTYANQVPANNKCSDAQVVEIPESGSICLDGTNINATTSGEIVNIPACKPNAVPEVWFMFVTTGTNNTITVTPTGDNPIQCPVITARVVECGKNTHNGCAKGGPGMDPVSLTVGYGHGEIVKVDIGSLCGQGDFNVCFESKDPPPTPGNSCEEATILCNKNTFSVDDMDDLNSSGITPKCFTNGAVNQDIWYKFTVGKGGNMEWTVKPNKNVELDWAMFDITDGCPDVNDQAEVDAKTLNCNFNFSGAGNSDDIGMQIGSKTPCPYSSLATPFEEYEFCDAHCFNDVEGAGGDVGRTYAIMIENFSGVGVAAGFTFEWGENSDPRCGDGSAFEIAPTAEFDANPVLGCNTLTTTVEDKSRASVSWDWNFGPGAIPQKAVGPGPHEVTYNDCGTHLIALTTVSATGCTRVAQQEVKVSCLSLEANSKDASCVKDDGFACVNAQGDGPFNYAWENYYNNIDPCLENIGQGDYKVTVTNKDGCALDANFIVNSPGSVIAAFSANRTVANIEDGEIIFTNESDPLNGTTHKWSFGDLSDTIYTVDAEHIYDSIGTFQVMLVVRKDETECVDTAYGTIVIKGITTFFVPNAFTPNEKEDNWNNTFGAEGMGITDYNMWIYDRWGILVWETNDIEDRWDGRPMLPTIAGNLITTQRTARVAQQDVYVWKAKFKNVDGETCSFIGHVTIIQ